MFEYGVCIRTKHFMLITLWTSFMICRVSTRSVPTGLTGSPTGDTYPPINTDDTYLRFRPRAGPIGLHTRDGLAASNMKEVNGKPPHEEDNDKEVVLSNNVPGNSASNDEIMRNNNALTNMVGSNNDPSNSDPSDNVHSNIDDHVNIVPGNNVINSIKQSYNVPGNDVPNSTVPGNDVPINNGLSSNFPSNNVLNNNFPSNNLPDKSGLENENVDRKEEVAVSNNNTPNHGEKENENESHQGTSMEIYYDKSDDNEDQSEGVFTNGFLQGLNSHGIENMMDYILSDLESSTGEYRTEHVDLESSANENGEDNTEPEATQDFDEDETITEKIQRNTEQETTPVYDGDLATDDDAIDGLINIIEQMIGNGSDETEDGKVITGVTTQVFVYPGGHIERESHPYERKVIQDQYGSSAPREMTQSSLDDGDSTEDDDQLSGYSPLQEILDLSQNVNYRAVEDDVAAQDIVSEVESFARPFLKIVQDVLINGNMGVNIMTEENNNSDDPTNIVESVEENSDDSAKSPIHIVKEIEIIYSL